MSRKIVGVTVGTPLGISAIKEKLNPVTSVNGVEADENGNVEITIPDSGGNVELDTTLTQSGKAADAKAVGDKIAEITGISLAEPAEDDMPKVFITGVKPTTKDDVLAEMEYVSKTDKFHAYLEIKCQGTSSMSYPKKNFTVKLYSDEARETKLKKSFKDWNHESNKFVLKANYIDHAHARNIVSARLWSEIVASRPDYTSLPVEMRNAPNNGAVDGFPIKVYYNGNYEGVYTWNIGKDDWMWGMDEDNANHVLLCAEGNTDGVYAETASNFRKLWDGVDGSKPGWSVEVGTNSTALKTSLNNLIQFVIDNDGDAFRNGIGNYLDIQSAIDYYIFQYEICGLDGLAHNMLLATYDGVVWRCGAYDLDATFGLYWNGSKFVSAQYRCPEDYQEAYSLLWERIEANFHEELKARQAELRKTVLSYSNIVTHFERFMDIIGLDLYAEDLTIYTGIPSGSTNNIKQIRNFIRDRQAYVDTEFAAIGEGGEVEPDEPDVPDIPDEPDVPDEPGEVEWTNTPGYNIDETTGEVVSGDMYVSSFIPVEENRRYQFNNSTEYGWGKVAAYTEDGTFVNLYDTTSIAADGFVLFDVMEPIKKVRLGIYPRVTSVDFVAAENNLVKIGIWSGGGYEIDSTTGEIVASQYSTNRVTMEKIPVEAGATYRISNINSGAAKYMLFAEYDANGEFIRASAESGNNTNPFEQTMTADTAFIMAKVSSSSEVNGNIEITKV